jgi:hypothetical protein
MITIWKAPLMLAEFQTVNIPKGAEFLTAALQHGVPTVWFMCDHAAPPEPVEFCICGTGHEAPEPEYWRYVGTCVGVTFVWHVFRKVPT